ncbi:hypothetical protein, partial [Mycobacterium heckeshornense]
MDFFVCCDGDPFGWDLELSRERGAVAGKARRRDDRVDVVKFERGLGEAAAGGFGAGSGELLFLCGRAAESKYLTWATFGGSGWLRVAEL